MKSIPLAGPDITSRERHAVSDVLKTFTLSRGPRLYEFEDRLRSYVGTRYAVAANSGTSALHIAMRAYNIKDGDRVITTPLSFIASSNSILFERAVPVFADIKKDTYVIDPDAVEETVKRLRKKRLPVRAILAVDMFGYLADWKRLRAIANRYGLVLIEDACEAMGTYQKLGSRKKFAGSFGDAGIFGFYPNKQITTGEGGALLTNDKKIADRARAIRNHGASPRGRWSDYSMLGYNYHINEMSCALGIVQLSRVEEIIRRRIRVARMYTECLTRSPFIRPLAQAPRGMRLSPYIYLTRLDDRFPKQKRDRVIHELQKRGISARDYFPTIHLSPFYRKKFGYKRGDFPIAEHAADHALALPFFNSLNKNQVDYVCFALLDILKKV